MYRLIFVILLILLSYGCQKKTEEKRTEPKREEGVVFLKKESQEMVGFESTKVRKGDLLSFVETTGEIAQEVENTVHVVTPETGAFLSYLVKVGDKVEKGTPLCVINNKAGNSFQVKSTAQGVVLIEYLKESDPVDSFTSIMSIADLSTLKASLNVYEKDLAGIALGLKVFVTIIAYPDRKFEGKIVFISPRIDDVSRTIKIRVDIDNRESLLKLGMFVTGQIIVPVKNQVLLIPLTAVQNLGEKTVVFVPEKDSKEEFALREIKLGSQNSEDVEVLSGLAEREEIISKGSFYLKSQLLKGELEETD